MLTSSRLQLLVIEISSHQPLLGGHVAWSLLLLILGGASRLLLVKICLGVGGCNFVLVVLEVILKI